MAAAGLGWAGCPMHGLPVARHVASELEYLAPDEGWPDQQLLQYTVQQTIPVRCVDSPHFLTSRDEVMRFFAGWATTAASVPTTATSRPAPTAGRSIPCIGISVPGRHCSLPLSPSRPDPTPAMSQPLPDPTMLRPLPASERVRERLRRAGQRFHANDNIAGYLHDGELAAIEHEVALKAQELLRALVIDVDNDHNTRDTGRRLAKMFVRELFAGRYQPAPAVTEFPNAERLNELMIVRVGRESLRTGPKTT